MVVPLLGFTSFMFEILSSTAKHKNCNGALGRKGAKVLRVLLVSEGREARGESEALNRNPEFNSLDLKP